MTTAAAPLEYANTAATAICPLCKVRPATRKTLYGYPVCKTCLYAFANRRQVAYLVDSILFGALAYAVGLGVGTMLESVSLTKFQLELVIIAVALGINVMFNMRDGFNGQSPGKHLTGVQVIDDATGKPISFIASFKRNAMFLLGVLPFVGNAVSFVLVIFVIVQMTKGYRLGDRFAGTRVLWKKYPDSPVFGGNVARCRSCHYDLTGNESGLCPECGAAVPIQPAIASVAV